MRGTRVLWACLALGCAANGAKQSAPGSGGTGGGGGGQGGAAGGVGNANAGGMNHADAGAMPVDVDATSPAGADVGPPSDTRAEDAVLATDTAPTDAARDASADAGESAGRCSASGWCWTNPLPQGNRFMSVFAGAANDVWLAGASRDLGHWDGAKLTFLPVPGDGAAWLVGTSASDIWGVDGLGGVIHYDGRAWTAMPAAPTRLAQGVYCAGKNDLWVMGSSMAGDIHHWDGNRWTTMGNYRMSGTGVGGTGPGNVWVTDTTNGVFRYDGQTWTQISMKSSLYRIQPVSATQAWACENGNTRDLIYIDGNTAAAQGFFDAAHPCTDLWKAPDGTLWAAGGDHVYRKKGAAPWALVGTGQLASLSAVGGTADEVFAVGAAGLILQAKNAAAETLAWNKLAGGRSAVTHKRIWAGPGVAWTASATAKGLFRWDGQRWQPGWATPDNLAINAVHGLNASDVWAVGEKGLIAHHDGTEWKVQAGGNAFALNAVWAVSATDVWAAGKLGRVVHFDGKTWKEIPSLLGTNFTDIWADATGGYAVGLSSSRSILAHYRNDPPRMMEIDAPLQAAASIWGIPGGPIYIGSDFTDTTGSALARYDGAGRSTVELAGRWTLWPDASGDKAGLDAYRINGIWGTSPGDVWVVAEGQRGPDTFHFDGKTWLRQNQGAGPFRGISGTATGVWVAGEEDAILRLRR